MSARSAAVWCLVTLIAIAFAAYLLADMAHETLGHGGMCFLLGGQIVYVSTTFEYCSMRSHAIDAAGPLAGILVALFAWAVLRWATPRHPSSYAFLVFLFAFAIFWNVGYMMKSGLLDDGDWAYAVAGFEPHKVWLIGLVVVGLGLYIAAMRVLGAMLAAKLAAPQGMTPFAFALTAYLSAALLSVLGALFDPRGPQTILTDALPSSLGSIGLPWVGFVLGRRYPSLRLALPTSPLWIAVGLAAALFFIAVLGPGLTF